MSLEYWTQGPAIWIDALFEYLMQSGFLEEKTGSFRKHCDRFQVERLYSNGVSGKGESLMDGTLSDQRLETRGEMLTT